MSYGKQLFAIVCMMAAPAAFAGELDPGAIAAPNGIIVRVDASGTREVFKAAMDAKVSSDPAAAGAVTQYVTDANRLAKVAPGTELDRSTSTEAWCYWYNPSYYSSYYYSYYSYGYSYNYYPSYNWNWAGYSYYYYYHY